MTQQGRNLSAWGTNRVDAEQESAGEDAALPDLAAWNLAGWIFRDGDCVAIARRGDEPAGPPGSWRTDGPAHAAGGRRH